MSKELFDRLHQGNVSKMERLRQRQELALQEELGALKPPLLNAKSKKIADRMCTQPVVDRCADFLRAREEHRERAALQKQEREMEGLTHNPEITPYASCLERSPDDWQRWDEKRREQLQAQQTRRLDKLQQECTFHPRLHASSEQYARRAVGQLLREGFSADGDARHASHAKAQAGDTCQRSRLSAKENSASTGSLAQKTSGKAGLPVSFENFMLNRASSSGSTGSRSCPSRPTSAGTERKAAVQAVAEQRGQGRRALQFEQFHALASGKCEDAPCPDAPQEVLCHAQLSPRSVLSGAGGRAEHPPADPSSCTERPGRQQLSRGLSRPLSARSIGSRQTPASASAKPMSARSLSAGRSDSHLLSRAHRAAAAAPPPPDLRGENFVQYSPELEDLLVMTDTLTSPRLVKSRGAVAPVRAHQGDFAWAQRQGGRR